MGFRNDSHLENQILSLSNNLKPVSNFLVYIAGNNIVI